MIRRLSDEVPAHFFEGVAELPACEKLALELAPTVSEIEPNYELAFGMGKEVTTVQAMKAALRFEYERWLGAI